MSTRKRMQIILIKFVYLSKEKKEKKDAHHKIVMNFYSENYQCLWCVLKSICGKIINCKFFVCALVNKNLYFFIMKITNVCGVR